MVFGFLGFDFGFAFFLCSSYGFWFPKVFWFGYSFREWWWILGLALVFFTNIPNQFCVWLYGYLNIIIILMSSSLVTRHSLWSFLYLAVDFSLVSVWSKWKAVSDNGRLQEDWANCTQIGWYIYQWMHPDCSGRRVSCNILSLLSPCNARRCA